MRKNTVSLLTVSAVAVVSCSLGYMAHPSVSTEPPVFRSGERIEMRLPTGETVSNLDGPSPVIESRSFVVSPGPSNPSGSLRSSVLRLPDGRTVWLVEEDK